MLYLEIRKPDFKGEALVNFGHVKLKMLVDMVLGFWITESGVKSRGLGRNCMFRRHCMEVYLEPWGKIRPSGEWMYRERRSVQGLNPRVFHE